jgi:hypothetical protein
MIYLLESLKSKRELSDFLQSYVKTFAIENAMFIRA